MFGQEFPSLYEDDLATHSIDLNQLFTRNVTASGSFDLRDVQATSFARLLQALPIPVLLVERTRDVIFVNEFLQKTCLDSGRMEGLTFPDLFVNPRASTKASKIIDSAFSDRKPQIVEAELCLGNTKLLGRLHLRSLRLGNARYILVLIQDLTGERQQLRLTEQHSELLSRAHEALERRVQKRTRELEKANERLRKEITERKKAEAEREKLVSELMTARDALQFQATHDSLSGIWNRSAILGILRNELARSNREHSSVGVIVADVDHFKQVNDLHGHLAGDAVLKAVAERMKSSLRPYDSVGRYGGEEFIFVIPSSDKETVRGTAERIRSEFSSNPINTPEGTFSITLSFGVTAVAGGTTQSEDDIIRAADTALYRAKHKGRNRVEISDLVFTDAL